MYSKVSSSLDFGTRELEILKFWKENDIFNKSIAHREGCPEFTFYEGPPTANGKPHVGHIITRVVKDVIPRYRAMKGYKSPRKAGWDTHGLPVELEVERALGISGKPDIEKYGVEPFVKKCKESVWTYKNEWEEMSERVGFWADMDAPYVTYHNSYIESVWWALKTIWDKGLLYKGHKVVPYCPRCGTSLSSHEVAQGYKDVTETSVYAKFKIKNRQNEYFLAWTTTPWTLPSNVGLTVNAGLTYARVRCGENVYILAEALLENVLTEKYELLETMKGAELERVEYEPLFGFTAEAAAAHDPGKPGWFVCCDGYVTLSEGTGIVHIAPAFGEDDSRVGKRYGLPFLQLVNESGCFTQAVPPWAGLFVKDADPQIIKELEQNGKLYKPQDFEHSYPFCWRCDTPLLYYARDTWFIEMTAVRDRLVANNETVNWLPEHVKHGRFGNFLENVLDWSLSRERYWGTPLPIWECGCGHRHAIGSVAELREMCPDNVPQDLELHKPYIDAVFLTCPECGGRMKRVSEVIDCWFDSGSMPFAQWHYPFENKDIFERQFPADFISEAVDQTRGWFYTLMAISTLIFDCSSFKNCIVLGHVQDKDGQKMSKHKGNVVDPWVVLKNQGADAVRWYFMVNSSPWLPSRFYEDAVNEAQRKFMGTFWNTYAFYVLYANIDDFNPKEYTLEWEKLALMDQWVLSRLHTLVRAVDGHLNAFRLTEPARAMNDFVDELSNWYVRRCRQRFWGKDMPQDKINAYMTLYTVLETLTRLSAPFIPFMTEEIYGNLVKSVDAGAPESVHLCDYPVSNPAFIDAALEADMDAALDIVTAGRAARNNAGLKNRQPIGRMFVKRAAGPLSERFVEIVAEELNVKSVEFTEDAERFTSYSFKPQLKTLGPKYGKLVPAIGKALAEADGNELMRQLRAGGATIDVQGTTVELSESDVLAEAGQAEGYMAEEGRGVTVVLDTQLTPELIEEGFVRELISKLQTMRKEAGFEVQDRIDVCFGGNDTIAGVIARNGAAIGGDVLADSLSEGDAAAFGGYAKEWSVNGERVSLAVRKITH